MSQKVKSTYDAKEPGGVPGEPRLVHKRGFLWFRGHIYAVPQGFQSAWVHVLASPEGHLHIYDLPDGALITTH